MNPFGRISDQISVKIPTDAKGMLGRQCPNRECRGRFKVNRRTGRKAPSQSCRCPYCGCCATSEKFTTPDQVAYAKSVALNQVARELHGVLKGLEFEQKPQGGFGLSFSMKVTGSPQTFPIQRYQEPKLETEVDCDNCSLRYAIYGEFAFCPDCGSHNSLTILGKNIEFVEKLLALAASQQPEMAFRLVGDALENLVSSFDGFGREVCRVAAAKATRPAEAESMSFQNPAGAQKRMLNLFGLDLGTLISKEDWNFTVGCFQKRHLLAHKMGVVDADYVRATNDRSAVVGRKLCITPKEVTRLGGVLRELGGNMCKQLMAQRELAAASPAT